MNDHDVEARFEVRIEPIPGVQVLRLFERGSPMCRGTYLELLETSDDFVDWYAETLRASPFEGFFWEHPPLTAPGLEAPAEIVLVDGLALTRLRPDANAFAEHFARHPDREVVSFANLGGDAELIVPCPLVEHDAYPHLAAFLRRAPQTQIHALLRTAATVVRGALGNAPRWFSTAGLGVSWLHLRVDTRPKYVRHAPYKVAG